MGKTQIIYRYVEDRFEASCRGTGYNKSSITVSMWLYVYIEVFQREVELRYSQYLNSQLVFYVCFVISVLLQMFLVELVFLIPLSYNYFLWSADYLIHLWHKTSYFSWFRNVPCKTTLVYYNFYECIQLCVYLMVFQNYRMFQNIIMKYSIRPISPYPASLCWPHLNELCIWL